MSRLVTFSLGQYILLRLGNFNSCPLIILVCDSSVGFNKVFLSLLLFEVTSFFSDQVFSSLITCFVFFALSRTTSFAFLSSRNPLKEGYRMAPSLLIARKLISATSVGFTQVTVAFGGLGRKREGLLYSGTSRNGH